METTKNGAIEMKELAQYFEDTKQEIETAETASECHDIADRMFKLARSFNELRAVTITIDEDAYGAWDADMEHFMSRCDELAKMATDYADDLEEEERDIEKYGSWDDQVRADYYASI